jgi:hypothetical protein
MAFYKYAAPKALKQNRRNGCPLCCPRESPGHLWLGIRAILFSNSRQGRQAISFVPDGTGDDSAP